MNPDSIERETIIAAPVQRVWALRRDVAPADGNSTSVESTLAGTDSDRARHVADNTQGWAGAFDSLQQQAERLAV
jgi:uncharacterized protein YndB with AHSA1/START domain